MRQREWERGRKAVGLGIVGVAALVLGVSAALAADRPRSEYNRDIRPILAENCFACHGPDSAARKADLRLDRRDAAIEAGAIAPKDPDSSELIARIDAESRDELMPPPKSTKTLKPEQKEILRRWIADGRRVSTALVADRPQAARAAEGQERVVGPQPDRPLRPGEARGERPATRPRGRPPHDRPPAQPRPDRAAPEPRPRRGVRQRPAPEAYDRLVTRLLDSPRWGEHRARYWLDAAALCRHQRLPLRQLSRSLGLSRLGHQRLQPQPAVRPSSRSSNWPATSCPAVPSTSRSPRGSTDATRPPTRAA